MSAALDLFNFREHPVGAVSTTCSSTNKSSSRRSVTSHTSMASSDYSSRGGSAVSQPVDDARVPFASRSSSSLRSCNLDNISATSTKLMKRPSIKSKSSSSAEENVVIEEKRSRPHGDGYTTHQYLRGKLLGKGGFAKVYLCTALDTSKQYAVKIVPKANLVKARARQKLQTEIKIHRTLKHKHVCEYKHFFEDRTNCYILLELCHNQSLNEMIKRRKRLTEPEAALFMVQMLSAVRYMHDKNVIHRDLKLGNLFLDRDLGIKVGDLGLATVLDDPDEKRKTICGTPNYIAPEVIQGDKSKRGHSFEVDIWSMGVILYTVMVGKPPYEAKDVKSTYQRILANEYSFPSKIDLSSSAKDLVRRMLRTNPADRPSLQEIRSHNFLSDSYVPNMIPTSAVHTAPKWRMDSEGTLVCTDHSARKTSRKPLVPRARAPFSSHDSNLKPMKSSGKKSDINMERIVKSAAMCLSGEQKKSSAPVSTGGFQIYNDAGTPSSGAYNLSRNKLCYEDDLIARTESLSLAGNRTPGRKARSTPKPKASAQKLVDDRSDLENLLRLCDHIDTVLDVTANRRGMYHPSSPRAVGSHAGPTNWVKQYVDYTSKYGLGFMLNDGSSGVYFNDATKAALDKDAVSFQYIERRRLEDDTRVELIVGNHTLQDFPPELKKKVTLLKHFHSYLTEQDKKAATRYDADSMFPDAFSHEVVYVNKWVRTKHALLFRLSDQTIQVVFYDQTEVLLTPDDRYITYVDKNQQRKTFNFTDELVGGYGELEKRLKYAKEILEQLVAQTRR